MSLEMRMALHWWCWLVAWLAPQQLESAQVLNAPLRSASKPHLQAALLAVGIEAEELQASLGAKAL